MGSRAALEAGSVSGMHDMSGMGPRVQGPGGRGIGNGGPDLRGGRRPLMPLSGCPVSIEMAQSHRSDAPQVRPTPAHEEARGGRLNRSVARQVRAVSVRSVN